MRALKNLVTSCYSATAAGTSSLPGTSAVFGAPRRFAVKTEDWFAKRAGQTAASSSQFIPLSGEKWSQRQAPAFVDELLQAKVAKFLAGRTLPRFVASLERGRYLGACFGSIVTQDDVLLQDVSLNNLNWCREVTEKNQHGAFHRLPAPLKTRLNGQVLALNTPFASNYHHFLLDTVPRIGLCEEAGLSLRDLELVITEYHSNRFQNEILARVGIDPSLLLHTTSKLHLQAKMLHVPSISEPVCREEYVDYTPAGMEYVRSKIRPPIDRKKKRRLLLSRRFAASRRWVEEEEALPALEKLGFVRIECESLAVEEQARLFGEAEAVIMPHGGGMANCVFCEPGTKIFELFHPSYHPLFMLSLSGVLGLQYHAISGARENSSGESHLTAGEVDVHLPARRMLDLLGKFL